MRKIHTADRPLDYNPLTRPTEHWTVSFANWLLVAGFIGSLVLFAVAFGA